MMDSEMQALCIDNGTVMEKVGFSGDDAPRAIFPSVIGGPKYLGTMVGMDAKDTFVGDEAQNKRGFVLNDHFIKNGIISNFNSLEKIWHHSWYNEMCVAPEEHPIFMTECVLSPKKQREKMFEIIFESFNVPATYIGRQPALNMFKHGVTDGCFVELGGGVCQCICTYGGYEMTHSMQKISLGGQLVTLELANFLNKNNEKKKKNGKKLFKSNAEINEVMEMKERYNFVSLEYDQNMTDYDKIFEKEYVLPDGSFITIAKERFMCTEFLFQPSLIKMKTDGIHTMIIKSILKCDKRIRNDLFQNIFISGGLSNTPGVIKRIGMEVQAKLKKIYEQKVNCHHHVPKVIVKAKKGREYSVWVGASILSSMKNFEKKWILKSEYEEVGAKIAQKCCV